MNYRALALDYDGTLAHHGKVAPSTIAALQRVKASGRKLLMVTGREVPDLLGTFDHAGLFDVLVAENGGLLHWPATGRDEVLVTPPPPAFAQALKDKHVSPLSVGRVVVATWEPHQATVLETIRELGLELDVIFNKGAVMVLPGGVNKGTGLQAALQRLELDPHAVVSAGDAENDHSFLNMSGVFVAVSNAVESLKARADWVTRGDHGAGVEELADRLIATDLAGVLPRPRPSPVG